jgi:hypothetical protein
LKHIIYCLPLLLCSCVGPAIAKLEARLNEQMQALDAEIQTNEQKSAEAFAALNQELEEGLITWDEYNQRADALEAANREAYKTAVSNAKAEAVQAVKDGIQDVENQVDAAKATAANALQVTARAGSGMLGLGQFGDLAATALMSAFGLNTYRNRKRRQRGEAVA